MVSVFSRAHKITSDCWLGFSCCTVKLQHCLFHSSELSHVKTHAGRCYTTWISTSVLLLYTLFHGVVISGMIV